MAGEFDPKTILEQRGPRPSGRRERDYQQPSFLDETYMEEAVAYLEDGFTQVGSNYGQGGVVWR